MATTTTSSPAMTGLEAAMAAMESARTTFEDAAHRVSAAVRALEEEVLDANVTAQRLRAQVGAAAYKRLRLSGGSSVGSVQRPEGDSASMGSFGDAAVDVEAHLQTTLRAMARVHGMTRDVRGTVDVAMARAAPLLGAERLATSREACNRGCSELIRMLERADLGGGNAYVVFGHLSMLELWRARGVCKAFGRWAHEALTRLSRPVVVGGANSSSTCGVLAVEAMNLATLQWTAHPAITVPPLPEPLKFHSMTSSAAGEVTVAGGLKGNSGGQQAFRWKPGSQRWESLPPMSGKRCFASAVTLTDGRTLVAGGSNHEDGTLASVEVLAADASGWETMAPMPTARKDFAIGQLSSGHVIVAGGSHWGDDGRSVSPTTVDLWDPVTNTWSALPPIPYGPEDSCGCVLPRSGHFAVIGGSSNESDGPGTVFDPIKQVWESLPSMNLATTSNKLYSLAVPVAGGLLAWGVAEGCYRWELFDEIHRRWFTLPHHQMISKDLWEFPVVSLSSAALEPPALPTDPALT
jgi:hypothetical protein